MPILTSCRSSCSFQKAENGSFFILVQIMTEAADRLQGNTVSSLSDTFDHMIGIVVCALEAQRIAGQQFLELGKILQTDFLAEARDRTGSGMTAFLCSSRSAIWIRPSRASSNGLEQDFQNSNPKETERTAIRPYASIRTSSCPTAI